MKDRYLIDGGKMKNLISIVVPCYNVEDYIDNCIESIMVQTYKNIEVIFVNDGSTDETQQKIENKIKDLDNFKLINQKNEGVASARNIGINKSSGEYIYFMDPDDEMDHVLLENSIKVMSENSSELIIFGYQKVNCDGEILKYRIPNFSNKIIEEDDKYKLFNYLNSNELFNPPWNKLYKKNIIIGNKIKFPNIKKGEDAAFNCEYFRVIKNITILDKSLYRYLVSREGSVEMNTTIDEYDFFKVILEYKLKLVSNFGIDLDSFEKKELIGSTFSECLKLMKYSTNLSEFSLRLVERKLFKKTMVIKYNLKYGIKNNIKLFFIHNSKLLYTALKNI